ACSNFPECRNTKPILKKIGVKCPKCKDGDVVVRKSKKGRTFYGCDQYPNCDFISWDKPVEKPCPECQSYMVEKRTKKEAKLKCSECDHEEELNEEKEEEKTSTECQSYIVEKRTKKEEKIKCSECDHEEELNEEKEED